MKTTKQIIKSMLLIASLICLMTLAYAASTEPSTPNSISLISNSTGSYPNGTIQNLTRGYIYTINIDESQPSLKWIGIVGNVTGKYGLVDAAGYALYDWTISTTTGEIYATREGPDFNGDGGVGIAGPGEGDGWENISGGGIPYWPNVTCADTADVYAEALFLNHTNTNSNGAIFEDSLQYTFNDTLNPFTLGPFYAGETLITDSSGDDGACHGIYLNMNNSDQSAGVSTLWQEVILTDRTVEVNPAGSKWATFATGAFQTQADILYAAKIYNNSQGYRNGTSYDFQMILPQSAIEGTQPNIPYYFYIELV